MSAVERLEKRFPLGVKIVMVVTKPIPGFGALPGDEFVVRRIDEDFPIVLRRTFDEKMLPAIPWDCVTVLYAVPDADAPSLPAASESPDSPALPAPVALRLVG